MNSFRPFGCKRKLEVFDSIEGFFELYSRGKEGKKGKNRVKNSNFLANLKSLNEFNNKLRAFK